eukprot:29191-Pelagococcus_subviridis.AAC.4
MQRRVRVADPLHQSLLAQHLIAAVLRGRVALRGVADPVVLHDEQRRVYTSERRGGVERRQLALKGV